MSSTSVSTAFEVAEEAVATPADIERLVVEQQGSLLRLAHRLVWDREEARDIVQATLADAWEKRLALRDTAAAPAWLRQMLVRRALNHLRRRRAWSAVRGALGFGRAPDNAAEAVAPSPESSLAGARRMQALAAAMARLSAKQQAAFALRYLEGLDLDGVAESMGIGRGTVRTHLHRALTALRHVLVQSEGGEP